MTCEMKHLVTASRCLETCTMYPRSSINQQMTHTHTLLLTSSTSAISNDYLYLKVSVCRQDVLSTPSSAFIRNISAAGWRRRWSNNAKPSQQRDSHTPKQSVTYQLGWSVKNLKTSGEELGGRVKNQSLVGRAGWWSWGVWKQEARNCEKRSITEENLDIWQRQIPGIRLGKGRVARHER